MRLFLLTLLFCCLSCSNSTSRSHFNGHKSKIKIAKKLLKDVYTTENIAANNYTETRYFHVAFEPLNDTALIAHVAFNAVKPHKAYYDTLSLKNIKSFLYKNPSREVFFMVDALYLEFLVRKTNTGFGYKKLDYYSPDRISGKKLDKIDF